MSIWGVCFFLGGEGRRGPNHQLWYAKWKLSRNMYTLHSRFCTFCPNLYAQSVIINKISASELSRRLVKSALLVGRGGGQTYVIQRYLLLCLFCCCCCQLLHEKGSSIRQSAGLSTSSQKNHLFLRHLNHICFVFFACVKKQIFFSRPRFSFAVISQENGKSLTTKLGLGRRGGEERERDIPTNVCTRARKNFFFWWSKQFLTLVDLVKSLKSLLASIFLIYDLSSSFCEVGRANSQTDKHMFVLLVGNSHFSVTRSFSISQYLKSQK